MEKGMMNTAADMLLTILIAVALTGLVLWLLPGCRGFFEMHPGGGGPFIGPDGDPICGPTNESVYAESERCGQ